jgi:hypothetical protein
MTATILTKRPTHSMDIQPATQEQVVKANDEDWVVIEKDLSEVVKELKEIDSRLGVRYNGVQKFYALYAKETIKGVEQEYLVNTFTSLDKRVVNRVREIISPSYDYVAELEKQDAQAKKEEEHKMHEKMGENAELLAFAIRKDLGVKDKAFF